jgi:MerR family redox-sensitive transcriptional activator SoxR
MEMTTKEDLLTIGQVAQRADVSIPTLRYYEQLGLVTSTRNTGNQRRYPRHVLRRLAFIAAAQRVGQSLEEIAHALGTLPEDKAPTRRDWTKLSTPWRQQIAKRIQELQALQNTLDECIGCGCLSLTRCAIYNPGDNAALEGTGSRWLRNASHP